MTTARQGNRIFRVSFKLQYEAFPADGPRHTQFRFSAPKARPKLRLGRSGNSLTLKQSGPLILGRA